MDNLATFLLGGAVGAALGYIASRRDRKKADKSPEYRTVEVPPAAPVASREEPALRVEASKMVTEVVGAEATAATTEAEVIESPEAAEAAAAEAEKIVAEAAGAETAEIAAEAAAAEATAEEVPAVEMPGAEGPAEEFAETPAEEAFAPEAAVAETAAPEAEEPAAAVAEFAPETETVAHESGMEPVAEVEAFVAEAEPEIIEFWEPADMAGEAQAIAEETVFAAAAAASEVDAVPFEIEVAEIDTAPVEAETIDTEAPETPLTAATGAEAATAISSIDDLKARIEETRRRIRQELEQPFISPADIEGTADWTVSPVVPVDGETTAGAAGVEEPAAEQGEAMADAMAYSASPEEIAAEITAECAEEIAPEPVDYESVKSRIELTRSRLKAKAFDAMMTGESALLSRDPEGAPPPQSAMPVIDSEIDQTIETSLSEQDN